MSASGFYALRAHKVLGGKKRTVAQLFHACKALLHEFVCCQEVIILPRPDDAEMVRRQSICKIGCGEREWIEDFLQGCLVLDAAKKC